MCQSEGRHAVVDYCIVGEQNMGLISNFKVTSMNECIEELKLEGIAVTRSFTVAMGYSERGDKRGSQGREATRGQEEICGARRLPPE